MYENENILYIHDSRVDVCEYHSMCHWRTAVVVYVLLVWGQVFNPYHADLRNSRNNKFVDEVVLSAHFTEEEVDFLLIRNESGADEGWIYSKQMEEYAQHVRLRKYVT